MTQKAHFKVQTKAEMGTIRLLLVVATALFLVTTPGGVGLSQGLSSCPDPFAGEQIRFNPAFWELTDFCFRTVPLDEIRSGGPPPDGIPPIDNPRFESIEEADGWLQVQSPVIVLEIDGDARAYPLAILTWHEIVNDEVGGIPVAVTFCPLCNSSIVFDRRIDDDTLRMGVSGLLRNSDLVMWDDLTMSWWQQLTGEAIVGVFAGERLEMIPSQVVGFGMFTEQYPEGLVLSRDTGHSRDYGRNPYVGYDSSSGRPFLFEGELDNRLPPTEHVLAGLVRGEPMAYPFAVLREELVINDEINDLPVVAVWQPGKVSALDNVRIDSSRDIGMAALFSRDLGGEVLTFVTAGDGLIRDEQTGSLWNVFGAAVEGELAGTQLRPQLFAPHFWFAWAAFSPDTPVYGLEDDEM
jgi:hypothetical protein